MKLYYNQLLKMNFLYIDTIFYIVVENSPASLWTLEKKLKLADSSIKNNEF